MLSHITGRTVHEEASATTRTYDVVASIRSVRAKWLGHILRMTPERMVHRAVQHMFHNREDGDLLMDAPNAQTWKELCDMAKQRDEWQRQVQRVKKGGTMQWRDNIKYRLKTGEISAPAARLIKVRSVTASTAYESARQYPQRDAREAFFRPRTKSQNTNERKRTKVNKKKYALTKTSLTDKERAAAAREHWELHYMEWTPPTISGYCNQHQQQQSDDGNQTLPITPPSVHSMIHYHDNMTVVHRNLELLP